MLLSILIPSIYPEKLDRFLQAFEKNTINKDDIELVILKDGNELKITNPTSNTKVIWDKPTSFFGDLFSNCYKYSTGEWIMIGNDDIIPDTYGWDEILRSKFNEYPDQIVMFWPNDNMFGSRHACFPITSRKAIELARIFPMQFRRYKIDDVFMHVFPSNRMIYLENVMFRHTNDEGTDGFQLPTGKIYPIDRDKAAYDEELWKNQASLRTQQKTILLRELKMTETKVLIGVPTAEFARQAIFYDYFNILEKPDGTIMTFSHGQSPAKNRNMIIQQALEHNCTHILFIDDDVEFPQDGLIRLLKHDKDVITGLYLMRSFPHQPIIFDYCNEKGECRHRFLQDGENGIVPIVNCGLGFCLIKIEVFKTMPKPWITLGELDKENWCDDISFFNRVRQHGFKLYCDLDLIIGHFASVTVKPAYIDGKWMVQYDTKGTDAVQFSVVNPPSRITEPEKVEV